MQTETAMAAAMTRAKYETREARIYTRACEMLTISKRDPRDRDGEPDIALCRAQLEQAYSDTMKYKRLPGKGQGCDEAQNGFAQSRQSLEGDGGQNLRETQFNSAASPSPNGGGRGQPSLEAHVIGAPAAVTQHDNASHPLGDSQNTRAPVVVPPYSPPSNLAPVIGHIRSKPYVHARAKIGADVLASIQHIAAKTPPLQYANHP